MDTNTNAGTDQTGVEEIDSTSAPVEQEIDLLDEFQAILEENKRLAKEKDDWKRVGLARKRGEPAEIDDDEIEKKAQERAQQIVQDEKMRESEARQREIALKALKENRELKIALKNRTGIVTTSTSSSGSSTVSKTSDKMFTPDQLAYFKKRGIDPEKVKANYQRLKS